MANERIICCCGASTWTKVIAWFQIIGNAIFLIVSIFGIVAFVNINNIYNGNEDLPDTYTYAMNVAIAVVAISIVFSLLGLTMGIILLKGTNQKRVGYLKAWLIYGVAAIISSVVTIILNSVNGTYNSSIGSVVISGILGIAINLFTLCVVYIHMKEINEGVFGQQT